MYCIGFSTISKTVFATVGSCARNEGDKADGLSLDAVVGRRRVGVEGFTSGDDIKRAVVFADSHVRAVSGVVEIHTLLADAAR